MKKYIPLLISLIALCACVVSLVFTVSLRTKLNAAEKELTERRLTKDESELSNQLEILTEQNIELREQLYVYENASTVDQVWSDIEEDISAAIKLYVDRDCDSTEMDAVSKKAYDELRQYCTENGFEELVPKAVYESLGKMPKDKDFVVHTNQWADSFQIWSKINEPGIAEVFVFYKYNTIPHKTSNTVKSNYALYVTMIYDVPSDTWQIDQVHYKELIQSKFKW